MDQGSKYKSHRPHNKYNIEHDNAECEQIINMANTEVSEDIKK